ncbi:multidrug ABC transporter ATP-binding protein [Mycobacterium sp. MS1601]|uniref:ABC transporter ATP-binding protein/permease n=1 Tax=Mycobacterium sp. MS1601 TaxID=1936029 RepID=UPI000979725D|nr:ABC transporter ATP-binding protein/permease [Mycobacterium sp. MS1601]AQA05297.1 multidrug ABC transporter ATP-binding protein [Mycobacterium sp. MS1601]
MFEQSIDWSDQIGVSLWWITWVFALTAAVSLAAVAALLRLTTWGRQFWRVSGEYFKGRSSLPVWGLLALLLLSVVASVRLDVLLSYFYNDQSTALQVAFGGVASGDDAVKQSGVDGFWTAMKLFALLATVHVARTMLDIYLMQRFIIRWRVWLTHRLSADWLDHRSYYRGRFIDDTIDNPDQRIQQDIDIFTTGVGPTPNIPQYGTGSVLLFGAISSILSVASFGPILWNLAGPLTLLGVTIPRALFWIAVAYVLIATAVAFWIGRPLIRLSFINEARNAAFRYSLVRLRDMAEAVGFYRGERAERVQLEGRFAPLIDNYRHYVRRTIGFTGWNLSASQAAVPLADIVQAPRMFNGDITFGEMTQSGNATSQVLAGLSFFRNAYDSFASFQAAIIRLDGLVQANEKARQLPELATADSSDGSVALERVEVRTPTGDVLINPVDLRLEQGQGLVITGVSGSGKTTLLRSLGQLWPFTSGTLRRPGGLNETMFLSQVPYVPLGDLRAVVSYPASPGDIPDADLQQALTKVQLSHLAHRLNEERDWVKVLSPGEQQRVAFARVLLTKPKAVFVDEATAALDEGLEFAMYSTVRQELPDLIMVSVSHRPSVEQHHEQELHLLGGGEWRLEPLATSR